MVIFVLLLGAFLVAFLVRRRAQRARLAGLDSARPVFFSDPPVRRHSPLSRESL